MTQKITNIAKNTSYFTLALVLQKVISFTYFILIARALGPADLGKYYFAIAFTSIFAIIIDLGLVNVLTREVAKTKEDAEKLLGNILSIKLPLVLIALFSVILLINLMDYPEITRQLVYLSSICMILDSFTATFFGVSRGFHNLAYESVASVVFQLIVLSVGLSILKLGLGLRWLMGALVAASIFNFSYSSLLLMFKWRIKLWPRIDKNLFKLIIKIAVPFGLFAVLQRIYLYLDSVLLSILAGDKFVGLYQVAFKMIFALQFLPLAFIASLYPAMSNYWIKNKEQLTITFERAMNYLIIISLPVAVGIAAIADKIILLFKTGYEGAILPLEISMIALFFLFVGYPVGSLLNACDKQAVNTMNMAVTVGFSIILNLMLIPRFQAVGASITASAANILMFGLGMCWVPKIIKYKPMKIISVFFKSLIATALMALLAFYLKNHINLFIVVPTAGCLYFITLFALGGVKKEDVVSIYRAFTKSSI